MVYRGSDLCEQCRERPSRGLCRRCQRKLCPPHEPAPDRRCEACEDDFLARGRDKSGTWVFGFFALTMLAPVAAAHGDSPAAAAFLAVLPLALPCVLYLVPDARREFMRERISR